MHLPEHWKDETRGICLLDEPYTMAMEEGNFLPFLHASWSAAENGHIPDFFLQQSIHTLRDILSIILGPDSPLRGLHSWEIAVQVLNGAIKTLLEREKANENGNGACIP